MIKHLSVDSFILIWLFGAHLICGERDGGSAQHQLVAVGLRSGGALNVIGKSQVDSSSGFPRSLGFVPICPVSDGELDDFLLERYLGSVAYKQQDLTGSPWGAVTVPQQAFAGLGITSSVSKYAWVNPASTFSDFGGYIYRNGDRIVGANRVCDRKDAPVQLQFGPVIKCGQPTGPWALGRMAEVNIPALRNAGAKRFTWVQGEEASLLGLQASEIPDGGFLYEVEDSDGNNQFVVYPLQLDGSGGSGKAAGPVNVVLHIGIDTSKNSSSPVVSVTPEASSDDASIGLSSDSSSSPDVTVGAGQAPAAVTHSVTDRGGRVSVSHSVTGASSHKVRVTHNLGETSEDDAPDVLGDNSNPRIRAAATPGI